MRRLRFLALLGLAASGCGNASGIEPGIPENAQIPADFDPGGDAAPDMTGSDAAGSAVP